MSRTIRVTFGVNSDLELTLKSDGATITEVIQQAHEELGLNIPEDAEVTINGETANGDDEVDDGDEVEITKKTGDKA